MHKNNMVREYKQKKKEKRATINLGIEGEPFRDLFETKCKGMSATEFFRNATFLMYSDDKNYKERKIDYLKHKLLIFNNDIRMLVEERMKIEEELSKLGVDDWGAGD